MKAIEISPANGADLREYSPEETHRRIEIQVGQASRQSSTQGRDGSPQPSQVSGATRRHPTRLRLKNRASQHPAPTIADQKLRSALFVSPSVFSVSFDSVAPASSPFGPICDCSISRLPRLSVVVKSSAFTLLEVLVATAVLALMMTFLFNLLGSSAKLWEIGNKKIEGAQAARIGLNIMADKLMNAFAGNMTTYSTSGAPIFNIAPFLATPNPTFGGQPTLTSNNGAQNAAGSQRLACVTFTGYSSAPYEEAQFQSIYLGIPRDPMRGNRYYLIRGYQSGSSVDGGNFYYRTNGTTGTVDTNWEAGGTSFGFDPIVDNCIRLKFEYYGDEDLGDENDPAYSPEWTGTWSPTNPTDRLPLGVLVTISVIDSKTAEKIAAIKGSAAVLTLQEIDNGLSSSPSTDVERLIAQGSVTMSRFIPFNAN